MRDLDGKMERRVGEVMMIWMVKLQRRVAEVTITLRSILLDGIGWREWGIRLGQGKEDVRCT